MTTLSIALATFNGARYIGQQLASLASQTLKPDEVLISDDGSNDDTLRIVREFAQSAGFEVTIHCNPRRLGFSDNFLHAANLCRHDLIAFCDQDDVWLPDKLEIMHRRMVADSSLLAMHTLTVTDECLRPIGFEWKQGIDRDRVLEPLESNPFGTGWGNSMMFRREAVHLFPPKGRPRQPGKPELPLSHDSWIFALCAALGRISQIDRPLVLYRQHGEAVTQAAVPQSRSLSRVLRVPLAEYRQRRCFDHEMKSLMDQLARSAGPMAAPASRAAGCFDRRISLWDARIEVFAGASVHARLDAFRRHRGLLGPRRHWLGSEVKDIVLGVSGLSQFLSLHVP